MDELYNDETDRAHSRSSERVGKVGCRSKIMVEGLKLFII